MIQKYTSIWNLVSLNKMLNQNLFWRHELVLFSCQAMSISLQLYGLQHARLLCPPFSLSLLKVMSIESVMLSNHLILCCPLLLRPSIFPSIRVFPMSWLFASGSQSIRVSASASVLLMNIQGYFILALTGLIFLQSRDS